MTSTSVSMASPTVRTDRRKCMLAFCLLLLLAGGSLFVGQFPLTISGILRDEPMQRKVFFTLRLARVEVGVVGGFTLGICGYVYQTVFRNPLASPDVIGVSSGASAGAAAGILFLLPLIVIFPLFMGIDGVMYAGPIADGAAAIVCGLFTVRELRELTRLQQKTEKTN